MLRRVMGMRPSARLSRKGLAVGVALASALFASLFFSVKTVHAATFTWNGAFAGAFITPCASPSNNMSIGANWVGGLAPGAGDDVVFPSEFLVHRLLERLTVHGGQDLLG